MFNSIYMCFTLPTEIVYDYNNLSGFNAIYLKNYLIAKKSIFNLF